MKCIKTLSHLLGFVGLHIILWFSSLVTSSASFFVVTTTRRRRKSCRARFALERTSIVVLVHVLKQVPFCGKPTYWGANAALVRLKAIRSVNREYVKSKEQHNKRFRRFLLVNIIELALAHSPVLLKVFHNIATMFTRKLPMIVLHMTSQRSHMSEYLWTLWTRVLFGAVKIFLLRSQKQIVNRGFKKIQSKLDCAPGVQRNRWPLFHTVRRPFCFCLS